MKRKFTNMAKKLLCLVLVLVFAVSAVVFSEPEQVMAAEGPIKFEDEKTYTQYDVTGDGKADTFKYDFVYGRYFSLYLNGKFIQQINAAKGVRIYLWQYSKTRVYLVVIFLTIRYSGPAVYQYSKSKNEFVRIADNIGKTTFGYCNIKGVPRKTLCFETSSDVRYLSSFRNYAQNPLFSCVVKYRFSGNKLKSTSNYLPVTEKTYYTAVNSFDTKATKKLTGRGPSVRAGDKVQLLGVYFPPSGSKTHRYKIKIGGKTGWFQDSEMCQLK